MRGSPALFIGARCCEFLINNCSRGSFKFYARTYVVQFRIALEIPRAVKTPIDGVCIVIGISVFLFVRRYIAVIISVFLD